MVETVNPKVPPKYNKIKSIGKGSFGEVFLATSNSTGETVCIKEVNLRGLSSKDVKFSMAEVAVLKKLQHPNIIAYRGSFRDNTAGTLGIVMEYADGGDLGRLISKRAKDRKRFTEAEVLKFLSQIVQALAYCHGELHLLHRDLKHAE